MTTNCNRECCDQHPNRRCYLPAGHIASHNDGIGHTWLNHTNPQLNTATTTPTS